MLPQSRFDSLRVYITESELSCYPHLGEKQTCKRHVKIRRRWEFYSASQQSGIVVFRLRGRFLIVAIELPAEK